METTTKGVSDLLPCLGDRRWGVSEAAQIAPDFVCSDWLVVVMPTKELAGPLVLGYRRRYILHAWTKDSVDERRPILSA
jgi:hypothetical protein